ncbi:MAG TPA: DUF5348 domain-containing protein [Ktedonobacteraceae bacterium]|nr:DUF5348 domain-containing protein [Ktedonobacteraceae bacterium]
MEENEKDYRVLVASSNAGRYALDHPTYGPDLTSGTVVSIQIGGRWVRGHVEHYNGAYAGTEQPARTKGGYVFIDEQGNICGLCAGLCVKLE